MRSSRRFSDRPGYLLRSPARALAHRLTRLGERYSADWLIYTPLRMLGYHRVATVDASAIARAISAVFPDARTVVDVGSGTGRARRCDSSPGT